VALEDGNVAGELRTELKHNLQVVVVIRISEWSGGIRYIVGLKYTFK
jgi:hypothetical protein